MCDGLGIPEGDCDCDGNVVDCFGECGGSAVSDDCGVCDGGNADMDCAYVCFGDATVMTYWNDEDGDDLGNGISQDFCSALVPDGWVLNNIDVDDEIYCTSNEIDDCDICDGGNASMDCSGECGGSAIYDECGVCDGLGIPEGECDCFGSVLDCNGDCNGTAFICLLYTSPSPRDS